MAAVTEALHAMPEVRALHSVSGAFDLVALGVVPTVDGMDALTDRIGAIDGRRAHDLVDRSFRRSSSADAAAIATMRGPSQRAPPP